MTLPSFSDIKEEKKKEHTCATESKLTQLIQIVNTMTDMVQTLQCKVDALQVDNFQRLDKLSPNGIGIIGRNVHVPMGFHPDLASQYYPDNVDANKLQLDELRLMLALRTHSDTHRVPTVKTSDHNSSRWFNSHAIDEYIKHVALTTQSMPGNGIQVFPLLTPMYAEYILGHFLLREYDRNFHGRTYHFNFGTNTELTYQQIGHDHANNWQLPDQLDKYSASINHNQLLQQYQLEIHRMCSTSQRSLHIELGQVGIELSLDRHTFMPVSSVHMTDSGNPNIRRFNILTLELRRQ